MIILEKTEKFITELCQVIKRPPQNKNYYITAPLF